PPCRSQRRERSLRSWSWSFSYGVRVAAQRCAATLAVAETGGLQGARADGRRGITRPARADRSHDEGAKHASARKAGDTARLLLCRARGQRPQASGPARAKWRPGAKIGSGCGMPKSLKPFHPDRHTRSDSGRFALLFSYAYRREEWALGGLGHIPINRVPLG